MKRHARLLDNIRGISKKVLTAALRKLERNGIVAREVYPDIPVRVEYTLTRLDWQVTELPMGPYEWSLSRDNELVGA